MSEIPIIGEVVSSERDATGTEWITLRLNKAGQQMLDNDGESIMVKMVDFRQHGTIDVAEEAVSLNLPLGCRYIAVQGEPVRVEFDE